jgi:hypothetical protein
MVTTLNFGAMTPHKSIANQELRKKPGIAAPNIRLQPIARTSF